MKIYPINNNNFEIIKKNSLNESSKETKTSEETNKNYNNIAPYYNDYLLSFGARVDKGLERFYNTNESRMPITVKEYVDNLDDKTKLTPLEAQQKAYETLDSCNTIDDIKEAYPNEPLFKELINPIDTKATRGILSSVKENNELLELSGQGVLKDKSNLTVYLVKKIFLENETLEEINQDLDKDLDSDFKADFKFKNPNAQYIYPSTLTSLGIKSPQFEYRQSLRYTRDGYSDQIGDKISEGQRAFWDSLSKEERTARAKISAQKFENWWSTLTRNQKLDLIADQATELDMLKDFKKSQKTENKKAKTETSETEPKVTRPHTKVGSKTLSQDELFLIWASNQLKIWQESLTEAEKDTIHVKRMQKLAQRWAEMTPEERTDYISKMKSGSEPLRYTMIDAWNHSQDMLQDLSQHLRQNQIYKPADLLYSTQEFSEFQSKVMTEFWEEHPQYTTLLGEKIKQSQEKIQDAISRGTFEELKKQIMRDKNQRIKEMNKFRQNINPNNHTDIEKMPEYMIDFKNAYYKALGSQLKNLPQEYINDYFNAIANGFTQEQVEAWTRNLSGEALSTEDLNYLKEISQTEPEGSQLINRAIEGALADTVYECTHDPKVYTFSHSDLKVALNQIDRGEDKINIESRKLNEVYEIPIIKRKIDKNRIARLYSQYKKSINESELYAIASEYFISPDNECDDLIKYMQTYGQYLNLIFSDKSTYQGLIKAAMFSKFARNMPPEIAKKYKCLLLTDGDKPLGKEAQLQNLKFKLSKRFDFIPKIYMDNYLREFGSSIRRNQMTDLEAVESSCHKRENINNPARLLILPKKDFQTINILRTLAMEETLADVLYDVTGNVGVYNLQFEELCDCIEIFKMAHKYPTDNRVFITQAGNQLTLSAKKAPNTTRLQQDYLGYINDIIDWVNTDVKDNKATLDDLLFILNPDENMPEKDREVMERIKNCNLNLS